MHHIEYYLLWKKNFSIWNDYSGLDKHFDNAVSIEIWTVWIVGSIYVAVHVCFILIRSIRSVIN